MGHEAHARPERPATRSRGSELRMLGRIELSERLDTTRGPTSGASMAAVLRSIDDHAHSPDCDTPLTIESTVDDRGQQVPGIVERTGRSESTVRRAIAGLETLGILDVEQHWDRHGRRRNRYLIDWSRIEDWSRLQRAGEVDLDAWMESIEHPPSDDPGAEATHHHDGSPPVTMTGATHHHDGSPPVTMTGRTTSSANSSQIPPPPPPDALARGWEAVAEAMSQYGVSSVWPAIEPARSRGCTADDLLAIVDHYRLQHSSQGWGPGALRSRIAAAGPGVDVSDGWPPPSYSPHRSSPARVRPQDGDTPGYGGQQIEQA